MLELLVYHPYLPCGTTTGPTRVHRCKMGALADLLLQVQGLADQLVRGALSPPPPPVAWAHFSPPCVELSKRKGEGFRNIENAKQDFQ